MKLLHPHSKHPGICRAAALIASTLVFAMITALVLSCLPIHGEIDIYRKVLRLHVIADSDSERDQSIKLSVRDALLDVIPDILGECSDLDEAVKAANECRELLLATANAELCRLGAEYTASLTLGEEYYPTREYDGVRLPAGRYTSLRIVLGDGEGRNWWCVLFPSLCLSAAKRSISPDATAAPPAENEYIAAGFTPEQYRTITETDAPRYRIRFKLLELLFAER